MPGRTAELRRRMSETQIATVQSGLSTNYASTLTDGYYLINGETFTCEQLTAAEAQERFHAGARLKKIDEDTANQLEIVSRVNQTELQEYVSFLSARATATAESSKKWTLGEDELETAAKAYAAVGASLSGIYAEVGASLEARVSLKVGSFQLDAKAYAQIGAGLRAGLFGVSAQASAETGIEDKATAPKITFKVRDVDVAIQFYACIKAFAKAEAYAGLGAKTGVGTSACIGLQGKIGLDIFKKDDKSSLGGLAVAVTVKTGAGIEASIEFAVVDVMDGGVQYREITGAGKCFTIFIGAETEITGRVQTVIWNEAENKITKTVKDGILNMVLPYLSEKAKKVAEEMEFRVSEAARKIKRGWDNTRNFGRKLVIAIEGGLGAKSEAMADEINRQVDKLVQYKNEVTAAMSKFERLGFDDTARETLISEVTDPNFKKRVGEWFGPHIDHKALKKELMLDLERYNRRIDKLNAFLDGSYPQTLQKVKEGLSSLDLYLDQFELDNIPDDFKGSEDYAIMVEKISEIHKMIKLIEKMVESKKILLKEMRGDQESFRGVINEMNTQCISLKRDFLFLVEILQDYVDNLPDPE
jgi:hypothetical protein